MEKDERKAVADISKAAFLGHLYLDEAAERCMRSGVKSICVRGLGNRRP